MEIKIPLANGLAVQIISGTNRDLTYPTAKIQKGLVLFYKGQDLSEEAVGFGVPILKRSLHTIFPGNVELFRHEGEAPYQISARYELNLEEKITKDGSTVITNRLLYFGKNMLAGLIRRLPSLRGMLTGTSSILRSTFGWVTTYEPSSFSTHVTLRYKIDAGQGRILVDLAGRDSIPDNISEIIVMNEQGAHHFDQYRDANGTLLRGPEIGCWDEVSALSAAFISSKHKISFSLPRVDGARLFLGRELIGSRLAWAGFGYSFPPNRDRFSYEIRIEKLP